MLKTRRCLIMICLAIPRLDGSLFGVDLVRNLVKLGL